MAIRLHQRGLKPRALAALSRLESWLEHERDQLFLWLPVMFGAGIGLWFALPVREAWVGVTSTGAGLLFLGLLVGTGRRTGAALFWGGLFLALGCGHIWLRSELVRAPVLERPTIETVEAVVLAVENRPAREARRLLLSPLPGSPLPSRIRLNLPDIVFRADVTPGATIRVRARLVPPAAPAIPGAYDFARAAWFQQIGATGRALSAPELLFLPPRDRFQARTRLSKHIQTRVEGSAGGIAAALATGDRGGIAETDEESMRDSGLTHLLSVSGLHLTAVVGGVMLVSLRLLAIFPILVLRLPLIAVAAACGACAGIGYTLLTGAEVPTVRSCIAAILFLAATAIGREALTLRLVAAGAMIVLLLWPEALAGASFQLSFAAITAIVALHDHPAIRRAARSTDDTRFRRGVRSVALLLLTGVAVEVALAPVALFHFHRSGLYGALANLVAIPLTTFIIMPAGAGALLLDNIGAGAPLWWVAEGGITLLLGLSRIVAEAPGAVAMVPVMPLPALSLMVGGGLWLLLWRRRPRWLGLPVIVAGALIAASAPAPDIIVTGDGRHMAIQTGEGSPALLRARTGSYVRDQMASGLGEEPLALTSLDALSGARCTRDVCTVDFASGEASHRIAAIRSAYRLPWREIVSLCAGVDYIVSDRRLPRACAPRRLKIDPALLSRTGGLAIDLRHGTIRTVRASRSDHPWVQPARHGAQ
jgi:competence protein ComEC